MTFVSFISNTTGVICGAGTTNPSGEPAITAGFIISFVHCVVCLSSYDF